MGAASRAAVQQQKTQLASSYNDLLQRFQASHLETVGNYTLSRMVGKGSFGKVYLATHAVLGAKVVLKSTRKDDANLAREIHHHRQMKHPHIAELYEVIVLENNVYLVLEYCPGQELYDYLLRHRPLPVQHAQKIFSEICGAVAYVHSKSCVHRDLKLENILLDKYDEVKLCDFGFTRESDGKKLLSTFCGTIAYAAPEMIRGEKYLGEATDVWSLGVILYALLAGELPFDEDDELDTKRKILTENPSYPAHIPSEGVDLLKLCLNKQKMRRPSALEILQHPFLSHFGSLQQTILLAQVPTPFSTRDEQHLLSSMHHAGIDTESIMQSVLARNCDSLAGFWTLALQQEQKRERRRQRQHQRRERFSLISNDSAKARVKRRDPRFSEDTPRTSHGHHSEGHHSDTLFKTPDTIRPGRAFARNSTTNEQEAIKQPVRTSKRQTILSTLKQWFLEPTKKAQHRTKPPSVPTTPQKLPSSDTEHKRPPALNSLSHYRRSHSGGPHSPYGSGNRRYSSRSALGHASTSSSFSSIRSLQRQSFSKASSTSSASLKSLRSPRSSRSSIKVLSVPPNTSAFPVAGIRTKSLYNEALPAAHTFAKRRKSPFHGPIHGPIHGTSRAKKDSASQSDQKIIREEDIVEEMNEEEVDGHRISQS